MPNLRYLRLGGLRLSRRLLFVEWRHIFDTVRDHPSVVGPHLTGLSIEYPEGLMDENYSFENHFYNEIRFKDNHGLRYWMNDWDIGMVETDPEDEEEGNES
ncbi:hypothetical protein FAGAP_5602 [Fusarium agapanthi]|uniref:Uncharacterized protein n=1 Tax=Fusarium agapanthi TaxID=1803897 RepID=A0A9P5ECX3_9HYPO|nr:hypothetical protein FAGAP_5602 [Fusarium agapanthi]